MALSNYTELQTAVQTELKFSEAGFVAAIPDMILRAEAKINRRVRLREMENLSTDTYAAATTSLADRSMNLPTGYIELINLEHKIATADDTTYEPVIYVDPNQIHKYYEASTAGELRYTLRQNIEFNAPVGVDHTIRFHYLKKWDIATDTTNWLLTNYPDVYLYGALSEAEGFLRNDQRIPLWKGMFALGLDDLDKLSERGRDDSELDVSEVGYMAGTGFGYNILTGR